jgi:hypothetical protein
VGTRIYKFRHEHDLQRQPFDAAALGSVNGTHQLTSVDINCHGPLTKNDKAKSAGSRVAGALEDIRPRF